MNPTIYLQPFLDLILSDETGAPITVDAVTSCRFKVTDPASEEVVLTKILQVYFFTPSRCGQHRVFIGYEGQFYETRYMMVNHLLEVSVLMLPMDENIIALGNGMDAAPYDMQLMTEPYGVPCMVEIFHFLCSLLNVVEHMGLGPRSNTIAFDEDFCLGFDQFSS
ncbi:unnamed protein product [Ilex paraguariensis]|uniref:Uncharacterized protein n=1 Tax=Ilex paraguariensis TaxID=185542 RepID=A0ABC8U9R8_9AQUA